MICEKCKSEIPDSAKFCAVCGATCAGDTPAGGNICPDCGSELRPGVKFCTQCGKAVNSSTVDLNKHVESPTPFAGGGAGVPTPTAPVFAPSGYSGELSGAAAVVVAPAAANKKTGRTAAIIVCALVAALIAAAAILFFTNKSFVMSLFMGKPRYAAMIEKDSVKTYTDKIDGDELALQIKSIAQIMSVSAAQDNWDLSDMAGGFGYMPLSAADSISDSFDAKALIKGYYDYMQSVYGCNSVSGSVKFSGSINTDDEDLKSVFDMLNGSEFTYNQSATESMLGGEFGAVIDGKTVNVKAMLDDSGALYIILPFVSDTAIKIDLGKIDGLDINSAEQTTVVLELDGNELKRLINELVDVYAGYIEKSSVTMDGGSLNIAGKSIEGKKIVADITGDNLENLIKDLFEHIADDQYLKQQIVEYVRSFDTEFTEADYKNAITSAVSEIEEIDESLKLVVTTIITNNGDTLAKSYSIVSNGMAMPEIAWAENGNEMAFDIKAAGQSILNANVTKTSEKDGEAVIRITTGVGTNISVTLSYSGAETVEFGKSQARAGTYTLKIDTSNVGEALAEYLDFLNGFSATLTTSVENGTIKTIFDVNANDMGSFSITADMSLSDEISQYSTPSDIIDITGLINDGSPDDETGKRIEDFTSAFAEKINEIVPKEWLDEGLFMPDDIDYSGYDSGTAPVSSEKVSDEMLDELCEELEDEVELIFDYFIDNDIDRDDVFEAVSDYTNELSEIYDRIYSLYGSCTQAQYDEICEDIDNAFEKGDAVWELLNDAISVGTQV